MGVMEAIKKGFSLAAKSMNLILVVFIFNLIWNVLGVFFAPAPPAAVPGEAVAPEVNPVWVILSILFILLSIFIQGGILGVVRDLVKQGILKIGKFINYGKKYYLRLLGLGLLIMLIILVIGLIAAIIVAIGAPTGNSVVIGITSILALIVGAVGLYVMLLLFLAPYIMVADDLGVIEAMKKSIDIVRRNLLKVLGLAVMLVLIAFGMGFVLGVVTGIISVAMPGIVTQMLTAILTSGLNAYVGILMTASFMSFYVAMANIGRTQQGATV
jgi:hypothetical protein